MAQVKFSLALCLMLISQLSFATSFLDEIKDRYNHLFSEAACASGISMLPGFTHYGSWYTKELQDKLPRFRKPADPDLFPHGMQTPPQLNGSTHSLFSIRSIQLDEKKKIGC